MIDSGSKREIMDENERSEEIPSVLRLHHWRE